MTTTVQTQRASGGSALLAVILAAAIACSGSAGDPGADGTSVALRTTTVAAGSAQCPSGGSRIDTGVDDDRDGALDDGEVDGTVYVCDGTDGQAVQATPEGSGTNCPQGGVALALGAGAPIYVCNGLPGANGQDGQIVTVTPESAGPSCTYGGQRLQVGSGTPSYVCNGVPGTDGQDGQSVAMTPELAGSNCTHGGQRLQVGAGAATYVCNGAPGADGESVTMTPEPPGPNCAFGGVRLQAGSGPEEYLCNGAPASAARPTVTTEGVTGVRYVEAAVDATVASDGGEIVLARGVVLATHPDPTFADAVFFSGAGTGAFVTRCQGLEPATTYHVRAFATNAYGTSYGDALSFTTLALTVPALSTETVSNVTSATAISGGTIGDDGGTEILSRGLCWALSPDPSLADSCVGEGLGAGSFIALMTGLAADTTYHVRAYAANAQGTGYGDDRTFTTVVLPLATVTTSAVGAVSYSSATAGGNVTGDNGSPVTSRGVCWSTAPAPTTAGACRSEAGSLGSFTASVTGLSAGTTYHLRAFAVNGGGTSYGNEVTFTTASPSAPSLTTKPVGGISSNLAGSGGVIAGDGGSPITAKGVCWSLSPNPTVANSKTTDGTGSTSFNSTMTGLVPETTYHVRAYATNALGTAYGNDVGFTTTALVNPGPGVPVVGTATAAMSSSSTASGGGYVSSDGGSPVTARGMCWSTTSGPDLSGTCSTDGGTGVGFFASTVTGLGGCGIRYYVRAYATNSTGTGYGNEVSVSTGLLPTVTTASATSIGYYDAISGGTIADDGGCAITQKGVAWSLNPNPTVSNPRTTDGPGSAPFSSSITGLYGYRTYYVRAYATNSVGTVYGAQEVFTTAEPPSPYLGQLYAGGIVFHIDGSGQHGLVAAPVDQGWYPWGCPGTSVQTGTAIGTGATNTAAIVASCGQASIAAKIADDLVLGGYDDWFLPSNDELSALRSSLYVQGIVTSGMYLSSTQIDAQYAHYLRLDVNYFEWQYKGGSMLVRAIRAF